MPSVGAVTSNLNVVGTTGNYTAKANDFVNASALSAALTVTLPTAPPINTVVAAKKTDVSTNMVAVVPAGVATINGDTAMGLAVQGAAAVLQFDGTNWQVLSTASVNSSTPVGLPTGGSTGQTLVKASGSNYDASWQTPATPSQQSGMLMPWTSGRLMTQPFMGAPTMSTTTTYSANVVYAVPVRIPNPCSITTISVLKGTWSQAYLLNLGIYTDNPTATSGGPAVKLGGSTITVNTGDALLANVSLAPLVISAPTTVWCTLSQSLAVATYANTANNLFNSTNSSATVVNASGLNGFIAGKVSTATYAPNSVPSDLSAVTFTSFGNTTLPIFLFTVA